MNTEFAKYVDNGSLLTKIDARIKLIATLIMVVLSFVDFNIWVYVGYFAFILLLTVIGKLSLKPVLSFFKGMWIIIAIVLLINIAVSINYLGDGNVVAHGILNGFMDTLYIVLRLLNIILISNLLTSSTKPNELTYAIEFYLVPLKALKIDVHEIALMMSIAIRFIPTLMEETDKIMKAQASRGAVFEHGKYVERMKSMVSLVVPLFVSCFEKSEDLAEAMIVKGYGIGERSKYVRERHVTLDVISLCAFALFIALMIIVNGVI